MLRVNKGGTAEGNFRPLNPSEDVDSGRVFSRFFCLYACPEFQTALPSLLRGREGFQRASDKPFGCAAGAGKEKESTIMGNITMDKVVALCKGRGFIFPGSEIYGGLA
ncbi:MAG: hypothetical protein IJ313_13325, partial [Clostridia bacterium]|nr:hypothetical protein [Clostridia bacterium]